jgi:hypothetical protein
MQMTRVTTACAADCPDLLTPFYFAFRFQNCFEMSVKTLNFRSVSRDVFDDNDISPTCAAVFSKSNLSAGSCENRLSAIGVAAGRFVPVFTEMTVFAEILRIVPRIAPVVFLADKLFFADRISETVFRKFAEQMRGNFFVRIVFRDTSRRKN